MASEPIIVAVSGGFDPIHVGHVRMIREAAALGDELVVILNNDHWLRRKKGQVFMNERERKEVIEAIAGVRRVVLTSHGPDGEDMSVCAELREVRPHIFANGGDRKPGNVPEDAVCEALGIRMAYGIGHGGKVQSSSWLTATDREERVCFCGSGRLFVECHVEGYIKLMDLPSRGDSSRGVDGLWKRVDRLDDRFRLAVPRTVDFGDDDKIFVVQRDDVFGIVSCGTKKDGKAAHGLLRNDSRGRRSRRPRFARQGRIHPSAFLFVEEVFFVLADGVDAIETEFRYRTRGRTEYPDRHVALVAILHDTLDSETFDDRTAR
ncbi:adenylyltransferase/cytidyltransferase family protein [Candidatus Uhrbacteria bacterium]|nr:adenylyltransferase/cytidyltransferase family protein [Candidatus Uhrbacteria bacterium]